MSNNLVYLQGSFLVTAVQPSTRHSSESIVRGWIFTDNAEKGGQHTFTAIGEAAEKMIEFGVQQYPGGLLRRASETIPHFAIDARGKLISFQGNSFLQARNVFFIGTGYPISQQRSITTNNITMAGKILLKERRCLQEIVGGQIVKTMEVIFATDTEKKGGHHIIRIQDSQTIEKLICEPASKEVMRATIHGRLVTFGSCSYILATFVNRDDDYYDQALGRDQCDESVSK